MLLQLDEGGDREAGKPRVGAVRSLGLVQLDELLAGLQLHIEKCPIEVFTRLPLQLIDRSSPCFIGGSCRYRDAASLGEFRQLLPDLLVIGRHAACELAERFIRAPLRRKFTDLYLNHALVHPPLEKTKVLER